MKRFSLLAAATLLALLPGAWTAATETPQKPDAKEASAFQDTKETETCVVCHEQETKEWQESPHARAINDRFLGEWNREGRQWECLVCHASRYDRKTDAYSHEGISCQSCHGPDTDDHPDKVKKLLPVTSEACRECHSVTYGEWRISGHGQHNIRCFDCHKMHKMELRKEDPDQMCGACHTEKLQDYSHATHHVKGVRCIDCHMPEVVGAGLKIKGTGVRGHSFGVGAETCANCHSERIHARSDRADLEGEIQRLKGLTSPALQQQVDQQRQEIEQLRASLQSLRADLLVFCVVVGLVFALGVAVGYAVAHRRSVPNWKETPPK